MKNEKYMEREMNFWDLCVAFGRVIGRGCRALWDVLARMIRLTFRYWWLVLPLVILAVAGGYYYSRFDNTKFRVNAVALLNGPTIQQFEQAYAPMRSQLLLPEGSPMKDYLYGGVVNGFETYRVVDCLDDETDDFIDFKRKSTPTDTVRVQMHDRLCLQFRIKVHHMHLVPQIEEALLATLNANPAMQESYAKYVENLREEVAFNHRQAVKLDSLTSCYYFQTAANALPNMHASNGVNFFGERKVRLFLDDIYEQQAHLQRGDYRLQLATAPVVLENHFAVDPKPINGRKKCLAVALILGWCLACLIAEIIDKRKAIYAWLKQ